HLIELGHTRVGMVTDSPQLTSSAERIAGYRRALRARGQLDESLISVGGSSQQDGLPAARALLGRDDRPTAIFTAHHFMTHGALLAGRELGWRLPADLAWVGFADLDWTPLVDPPLTVVSQPVAELGQVAGERLLARIGGDESPPRRIRLATRLIVRGSCGTTA